jgi:SAM-dependent methyltransferase
MPLAHCHVCGGTLFATVASAAEIGRELRLQREFVFSRLRRRAARTELKDLTDFMHGFPAPLVQCRTCGVLTRAERRLREAQSYEEDPNDPDLMTQVYPRYVEAFRHKRAAYEPLLQPRADVLEIGSHLGAFLQTAEEWNWQPVGLDVGKDTSEFARSQGVRVRREVAEDSRLPAGGFHAAFVWNCFEQLPRPARALAAIHRLLNKHGLLIIRVPNVAFYRALAGTGEESLALRALAYNNLLGFPYLHGYTEASLNRLVSRMGFEYVRGFNSELITMPFADVSTRIHNEQSAVSETIADWSARASQLTGALTGPWIELVYRRLERSSARPTAPVVDPRFLKRAS